MANKYTNRDLLEHNFNESDYASINTAQQQKTSAEQALANLGEYNFNYGRQNEYDNALNAILNRKKFSYDLNGDALYQQYKDNYINQGKMAMMDTMGQAAAMTGGYGNSYAATVGNQAYQASLQNLNNIVPELYKLALESYNAEGDRLNNNLNVLGTDRQLEENSYSNKYNADLTRLSSDREYYSKNYTDTYTKEYNNYVDYITNNNDSYWNEYNTGYQAERDAIADQQWKDSYDLQERQVKASEKSANAAAEAKQYAISNYSNVPDSLRKKLSSMMSSGYKMQGNMPLQVWQKKNAASLNKSIGNYLDGMVASQEMSPQVASALMREYYIEE